MRKKGLLAEGEGILAQYERDRDAARKKTAELKKELFPEDSRIAKLLKNYQKILIPNIFYFILYLCALEIAPLVVIGSYLKD